MDQFRKNWAKLLTPAEYAYNSAPVVTMDGLSPFEVDTGQKPKDHAAGNRVIDTLDDYRQQCKLLRQRANDALQLSQYNQKLYYDKTRRHEEFKVGDMVYLSTKRYKGLWLYHLCFKANSDCI